MCRRLGMTSGQDPETPIPQHRPGLDYDHPIARLDRVTLMSHAIWTLAAERLQLSDDQLKERMMELDLEDGVRDRKVTVAPKRCECGVMVAAKPGWCISCGEHSIFSPFAGI